MQCKDNNFQEEKKKNRIIFKFSESYPYRFAGILYLCITVIKKRDIKLSHIN